MSSLSSLGWRFLLAPGGQAGFRLPAVTWRKLMDHNYPNTALLSLRKDTFDRLDSYRRNHSLLTWEHALDRLLASANEPVIP